MRRNGVVVMSMTCNFHTDDLLNKAPLRTALRNWPSSKYPSQSYATVQFSQAKEGEVTLFVRHGQYADLIAGLEGVAKELRAEVAKEMVMTWGFPGRMS